MTTKFVKSSALALSIVSAIALTPLIFVEQPGRTQEDPSTGTPAPSSTPADITAPNTSNTMPEAGTSQKTIYHYYPSQSASTTGAKATCSLISWKKVSYLSRDDTAQITCSISDTQDDGHQVYVKWWQDGYGDVHLTNSQGSGTTVTLSDARYNPDGSFGTAYWQVCRDIRLGRDNCSDKKSWSIK